MRLVHVSRVEAVLLLVAALLAFVGYGGHVGAGSFEPGQRGERGESVLRVVTWNVGGKGTGRGHALAGEDVGDVVRTLALLDAELVFLQELQGRSQLEAIAAALPAGAHTSMDPQGRLGVIARRGSLLTQRARDATTRPLVSIVYEPDAGGTLHAVSLHASPWSAERRNAEIGAAVDLLEPHRRGRALLLCGDLNLDVDPGGRRDLFTDDEHRDIETYNYVAERLVDSCAGGGPTAEPDRRLDYVFVSGDTVEVVAGGAWRGRKAGDMDHDPVVVDLLLR